MRKADPRDELRSLERSTGLTLDDPRAAVVLATLRKAGIFDDRAWAEALHTYKTALIESAPAPVEEHDGVQVIQLSAMNEDWICIVRVKGRLTREMPDVAAWCLAPEWHRNPAFWRRIDKLLKGLGMKRAWNDVAEAAQQAAIDLAGDRGEWEGRRDGFGTVLRPTNVVQRAKLPRGTKYSILRRKLDPAGYNLPDAAIHEAISTGRPTVAILQLDGPHRSKFKDRAAKHVESLRVWQEMLWDLYGVIFLLEKDDTIEPLARTESWPNGDPVPDLKGITEAIDRVVAGAVKDGILPAVTDGRGDSRKTESELKRILLGDSVLARRLTSATKKASQAPGWGHRTDLAFTVDKRWSLAIEVKVTEDWDHPLGEPLACLLEYDAVINVRIACTKDKIAEDVRAHIAQAEQVLVDRGRGGFVYQPAV